MIESVFLGLSVASILLLIALGLAITYGAMGIINMAHGELLMIGAYCAVLTRIHLGFDMFMALPVAFVMAGATGALIEVFIVRRLYNRLLDTLLATWGVAIVLQQAIRLEFGLVFFGIHIPGLGSGLQNTGIPQVLQGSWQVAGTNLPIFRTFVIGIALIMFAVTWWIYYRTSLGTQLRAIARNAKMAAACGVNVKRINTIAFSYGAGLAGMAGVLLSGFESVKPDMGSSFVINGFLVVVTGGVSSLFGTLFASGLLGEARAVLAIIYNDVLAQAAVFAGVILIILVRPSGLFSPKQR
ncbi:urea ABC transporter permease subunit UrtB [Pontibaca salina]|uniref:Urea ABC transporter permease subunit UrtB n=1 Tax=Pontibaca salina TaxID=2795731 RepID=A0A934HR57_9RHOB|nr:urea ABC transporter permease subunit UrtB [Pontibaca salina]MBI6629947.1 urea ABC transporter permease subunit UrtB [Pontibaca salina]